MRWDRARGGIDFYQKPQSESNWQLPSSIMTGIFVTCVSRTILNNRSLAFRFTKDLIPLRSFTLILFICIKHSMLIATFFISTVRSVAFTSTIRSQINQRIVLYNQQIMYSPSRHGGDMLFGSFNQTMNDHLVLGERIQSAIAVLLFNPHHHTHSRRTATRSVLGGW